MLSLLNLKRLKRDTTVDSSNKARPPSVFWLLIKECTVGKTRSKVLHLGLRACPGTSVPGTLRARARPASLTWRATAGRGGGAGRRGGGGRLAVAPRHSAAVVCSPTRRRGTTGGRRRRARRRLGGAAARRRHFRALPALRRSKLADVLSHRLHVGPLQLGVVALDALHRRGALHADRLPPLLGRHDTHALTLRGALQLVRVEPSHLLALQGAKSDRREPVTCAAQ